MRVGAGLVELEVGTLDLSNALGRALAMVSTILCNQIMVALSAAQSMLLLLGEP